MTSIQDHTLQSDAMAGERGAPAGLDAHTALAQYALTLLELGLGRYASALTCALKVYRDDPPDFGTQILPDLIEAAQAAALEAAGKRPGPGADLVAGHLALLDLSKGRYQDAFERLTPIVDEDRLSLGTMMLADFIEAAARTGRHAEATTALDRLTARATAGAARLGLGRLARCRALLDDNDRAEAHYRASIEGLGDTDSPTELARSRLVYGEWLRRRRRRRDARSELNAAYDTFARIGAHGFAERARIELSATGASTRDRTAEAADPTSLTSQEKQIASLVADGHTNSEVAAKLFISPATVDYHLRKTYQKLGVSSRTQMARKINLDRRADAQ